MSPGIFYCLLRNTKAKYRIARSLTVYIELASPGFSLVLPELLFDRHLCILSHDIVISNNVAF